MARYYKRRYKKRSSGPEDAFGLLALLIVAYMYTGAKDFTDKYPYGLAILVAVTVFVLLAIGAFIIYRIRRAKHIYDAITLSDVDSMDGLEFEKYLANLLRKRGYTDIRLTERYDYGIDIIAKKDGFTWGIQAKRYKDLVKAEAVRQTYTAMKRYKCDRAMVITSSVFSNPAKILAADNHIVLVDRTILSQWIYEADRKSSRQVVDNNGGAIL